MPKKMTEDQKKFYKKYGDMTPKEKSGISLKTQSDEYSSGWEAVWGTKEKAEADKKKKQPIKEDK